MGHPFFTLHTCTPYVCVYSWNNAHSRNKFKRIFASWLKHRQHLGTQLMRAGIPFLDYCKILLSEGLPSHPSTTSPVCVESTVYKGGSGPFISYSSNLYAITSHWNQLLNNSGWRYKVNVKLTGFFTHTQHFYFFSHYLLRTVIWILGYYTVLGIFSCG